MIEKLDFDHIGLLLFREQSLLINHFFFTVDGNYSEWSDFQACSVSCGKGIQARSRSCINPPPQHGGKNCSAYGPPVETKECSLRECPSMAICCILFLGVYKQHHTTS